MINKNLHSWSFNMKFMKLAEGSFHKCHMKWPLVWDPLYITFISKSHQDNVVIWLLKYWDAQPYTETHTCTRRITVPTKAEICTLDVACTLYIRPANHQSLNLSNQPTIRPSISACMHLLIHPMRASIHACIRSSMHPSVHISIHLSNHPSILNYLSIRLSIHPSSHSIR